MTALPVQRTFTQGMQKTGWERERGREREGEGEGEGGGEGGREREMEGVGGRERQKRRKKIKKGVQGGTLPHVCIPSPWQRGAPKAEPGCQVTAGLCAWADEGRWAELCESEEQRGRGRED